ncbi:hypothetical protein IM697_22945 [Streptomyces ferrugineus]|uniref:Uncharacterized protein n=1 Tax=Streptomyces ferrugineus TaxID=1413221 RepID=A0A7M2SBK4_9ACTN|nr:DUF5988 family protein [Streptomyces ferrugineus]QOV33125.1 hypothetical protein IM697_22945 [Streptomyces ferrugineus]
MSSDQFDAMPTAVPNVVLRGGPTWLPEEQRTRSVADVQDKLKLLIGNAYEHFEPTAETAERDGVRLRVFEWTYRTYVAE